MEEKNDDTAAIHRIAKESKMALANPVMVVPTKACTENSIERKASQYTHTIPSVGSEEPRGEYRAAAAAVEVPAAGFVDAAEELGRDVKLANLRRALDGERRDSVRRLVVPLDRLRQDPAIRLVRP